METPKQGQTINENTATTGQNIASNSGTSGTQNEQEIVKIDVVKELDNLTKNREIFFDEKEKKAMSYLKENMIFYYDEDGDGATLQPKELSWEKIMNDLTLIWGNEPKKLSELTIKIIEQNNRQKARAPFLEATKGSTLFWDKKNRPNKVKEISAQLTGLDKIFYDRLSMKAEMASLLFPNFFLGGVSLKQQLENRLFSSDEVKDIVAEYEQETQKKLIVVREQLERERQEVDETITKLETKLKEAGTENIALIEEAQKKEETNRKQKAEHDQAETKRQEAIQSKEKAEYEQIRDKYQELEAKAQNDAERLELANRKITELIQLNYQSGDEIIEIVGQYKSTLLECEARGERITVLAREKAALKVNFNAEKREHQTTIKRKDRDIAFVQKYYEQEKAEKEQVQADKEALRQDYIRVCDERDKAIETSAPKWLNNLTKYSDRFLGTDIQKGTAAMWKRGRLYGRWLFFLFLASIALFILSWIVRILAAVFRNVKAIFTKKQNTAEILKELVSGVKEAKDSVIKSKPKEQPETKEAEVIEVQPINETSPIAQNPEAPAIKKNGKRKKKSKKKK